LVVLHAGSLIAQGDPRTVISTPVVQDIYMAADA
jgi:ABC-type branched-subunit amino acid transport system ATPase component